MPVHRRVEPRQLLALLPLAVHRGAPEAAGWKRAPVSACREAGTTHTGRLPGRAKGHGRQKGLGSPPRALSEASPRAGRTRRWGASSTRRRASSTSASTATACPPRRCVLRLVKRTGVAILYRATLEAQHAPARPPHGSTPERVRRRWLSASAAPRAGCGPHFRGDRGGELPHHHPSQGRALPEPTPFIPLRCPFVEDRQPAGIEKFLQKMCRALRRAGPARPGA